MFIHSMKDRQRKRELEQQKEEAPQSKIAIRFKTKMQEFKKEVG